VSHPADEDDADPGGSLVQVTVPADHCTQAAYRKGVSQRLRMARVALDISQQEVAEASGCSRNFVSAVERGVQGMDAYRLSLIATALRMRPRTLLDGDDWDHWMHTTRFGQ
jgi:DNA-binding XRE family transcriptional regulator